jgi:hypothetical protein
MRAIPNKRHPYFPFVHCCEQLPFYFISPNNSDRTGPAGPRRTLDRFNSAVAKAFLAVWLSLIENRNEGSDFLGCAEILQCGAYACQG